MELRLLNLVIGIGLIAWSLMWWKQNHGAELYAFPVLLFGLHVVSFNATILLSMDFGVFSHGLDVYALNAWSNGIRLHGLCTIALVACALKTFRRRVV